MSFEMHVLFFKELGYAECLLYTPTGTHTHTNKHTHNIILWSANGHIIFVKEDYIVLRNIMKGCNYDL